MPWVRRSHETSRFYWILAGIGAVMAGILSGYSWWGDTASVVTIVEQQLGHSQAQVRMLEKRVNALEVKLGIEDSEEASARAY
jgi:hypothetical protein